ncbi:MAG: DUF169 domain-containing protein [Candidatus Moranbacteria bacterium]|nr:DUF169 domain-containing protein [bacterium]MDP1833529.1 DUF169 domain-containing protein [Candidatus Moranbacteria bacterium]
MKNLNTQIKQLKKILNIDEEILSVTFVDADFLGSGNIHRDTACTAIARAFKNKEAVVVSAKNQLCPGADYFLKLKKIKTKEAIDAYVEGEKVFENKNVCQTFLRALPKYPIKLMKKDIVINSSINVKTQLAILLINPAQANRIIGLLNFDRYNKVDFLPNQPTCISLFAPLVSGAPHINFMDYYDRYYQGKINKKYLWPEDKMIISLRFSDFKKILKNLEKSPHGNYIPRLYPQKADAL